MKQYSRAQKISVPIKKNSLERENGRRDKEEGSIIDLNSVYPITTRLYNI